MRMRWYTYLLECAVVFLRWSVAQCVDRWAPRRGSSGQKYRHIHPLQKAATHFFRFSWHWIGGSWGLTRCSDDLRGRVYWFLDNGALMQPLSL